MKSKSINNANVDELKEKYKREKLQHYITKIKLIKAEKENKVLKEKVALYE